MAGFVFVVNQARASRLNVCSGLWPMVIVLLRFEQVFFIQDALSWCSVLETSMSTATVEFFKLKWRHFSSRQFGQNCLFSYKKPKRTQPAEYNTSHTGRKLTSCHNQHICPGRIRLKHAGMLLGMLFVGEKPNQHIWMSSPADWSWRGTIWARKLSDWWDQCLIELVLYLNQGRKYLLNRQSWHLINWC